MITRSNYEIVFVDYFDGKLGNIREEELFQFLKDNPDLQEEFNLFAGVKIEPDLTLTFSGKEHLKKNPITISNYKTWLTAYLENDLEEAGKREVEKFLNENPSFKKDLEILKLTRLVPDHSIIYYKKNSLKRGGKILPFNQGVKRLVSIAAALFIMAVAYFIVNQLNSPTTIISDNQKKEKNDKIELKENIQAPVKDQAELINPKVDTQPKDKIKSNSYMVAERSGKKVKSIDLIDPKQVPVNAMKDSLQPMKKIPNEEFARDNNNNNNKINTINNLNGNNSFQAEIAAVPIKQITLDSKNISDIFSDEEVKELKELQKDKLKKSEESTRLVDLASKELNKLSKKTDITFEKVKDPESNSVTYAFGLGKNFSVSHTSGR